ncbi:MAG: hypothetical protein IJT65_08690 [Eubacterium sp.]|nr:hypothetical protein [Eubacterium sp.]
MPSNERELARKAKKQKKQQRTRRIIWGVIIGVIILLTALKIAEIDFSAVKDKLTGNDGKLAVEIENSRGVYPLQLDSSKDVKMVSQNDKLSVLTSVSYTSLNPTTGKSLNSFNHGYANPIMKNAGNYAFLFDQGARRMRLETVSDKVFQSEVDSPILTGSVCKTGNVIYATKENNGQSNIYVVNSSLKNLMNLKVSDGYVVNTAIDPSGKKIAYAVLTSKKAKLITTVYTMNVGDKKVKASFEFSDSILDISFSSGGLYVVGTNSLNVINGMKRQKEIFKTGSVNTVCFCYSNNNDLIYIYSKYNSANENFLTHISASGKVTYTTELKQKPKYVSCESNEISVLFSDRITVYSFTKGEKKSTYKCDGGVSSVSKLSTKLFVTRHQLIDVIE